MAEEYRFKDQLKKLTDVVIKDPRNGDVLEYDADAGVWRNRPQATPTTTIGGAVGSGIFDLNSATSLADFATRINAFLSSLAPTAAPSLSSMSCSLIGSTGRVSYGTDYPLGGVASVAGIGSLAAVLTDGQFAVSGHRRGITTSPGTIVGTLADNVAATSSYPVNAFGDGKSGTLILEVNGTAVRSADLTVATAITDTNSGFVLSAPANITFPNGDTYASLYCRTGTFRLLASDLREGWNYVRVRHQVGTTYSDTDYFDFVYDSDATTVTFASESIGSVSLGSLGHKFLSGIKIYRTGTFIYSNTISNLYRNTYKDGAIQYTSNGPVTVAAETPVACSGDRSKTLALAKSITLGTGRVIGSLSVSVNVSAPGAADVASSGATLAEVLYDALSDSETDQIEDFTSESKRVKANANFDSTSVSVNWDGTTSLLTNDGLQVINGSLIYPRINYSTYANGAGTNPNYSTCIGERTFYRIFRPASGSSQNFVMNIEGIGVIFVAASATFSASSQMKVAIKAPSQTGWLDAYADYHPGEFNDGDGCRRSKDGAGRALSDDWGLTLGTKATALSGNAVVLRVTVPRTFTGKLTRISFEF